MFKGWETFLRVQDCEDCATSAVVGNGDDWNTARRIILTFNSYAVSLSQFHEAFHKGGLTDAPDRGDCEEL